MRPRRLAAFDYTGFYAYSLTFCTFDRRPYFTDPDVVGSVLRHILRTASACAFDVPAYCFMPDHLHLLICGSQGWSHLPTCLKLVRQRTAVEFSRVRGERLWQAGYFEHVLRNDEAVETVARYIEGNPVRAGLATIVGDWPFTGGSFSQAKRVGRTEVRPYDPYDGIWGAT